MKMQEERTIEERLQVSEGKKKETHNKKIIMK